MNLNYVKTISKPCLWKNNIVTPASYNFDESMTTLRYANRAKVVFIDVLSASLYFSELM